MILIYLGMLISPKLEVISLKRNSSTCELTILATRLVLASVQVCEFGVILTGEMNQVLTQSKLG